MSPYILEFLYHIKQEIDFLSEFYSSSSASDIAGDPHKKRAAERSLTIIGEATKKIPKDFRESHPEIEWRAMAGMRDIIIHDYANIDYEIVWSVIHHKIPELKLKIDKLVEKYS